MKFIETHRTATKRRNFVNNFNCAVYRRNVNAIIVPWRRQRYCRRLIGDSQRTRTVLFT